MLPGRELAFMQPGGGFSISRVAILSAGEQRDQEGNRKRAGRKVLVQG